MSAEEISPGENDEIDDGAEQATALADGSEIDPFSETEEEDVYLDSFTIPWGIASEVIALTPTPEPTAESSQDAPEQEIGQSRRDALAY